MKERALIFGGFGCIAAAVATLVLGSASAAILTFVSLALGAGLLLLGLMRMKGNEHDDAPVSTARTERGDRLIWIVGASLAGFAIVAAIVAVTVAVGEAVGHAVSHLVMGLACLTIYVGLAALWHPQPASGKASFRGMALLVLAIGAFGSSVESLGGAGYDAANHRAPDPDPRVAPRRRRPARPGRAARRSDRSGDHRRDRRRRHRAPSQGRLRASSSPMRTGARSGDGRSRRRRP